MSITYGFFNSINGDRVYDAIDFSRIFDGIINDGVYEYYGNHFIVRPSDGMTIIVGSGRAWFDHTWTLNDSDLPMTINEPDLLQDRIDAVVIKVDSSINTRKNSIEIIEGLPAEEPVPPTLTNTASIHYHLLAYVNVRSGTDAILQSDITNKVGMVYSKVSNPIGSPADNMYYERSGSSGNYTYTLSTDISVNTEKTYYEDVSPTPYVTGIIKTVSIDSIVAKWSAEWDLYTDTKEIEIEEFITEFNNWVNNAETEFTTWSSGFESQATSDFNYWFDNIKGRISSDVAQVIQNKLDTTFNAVTYDNVNDRLIFTTVDNQSVPVTISSGHHIENETETEMPKRKNLMFENAKIIDDANKDATKVRFLIPVNPTTEPTDNGAIWITT